MKKNILLVEDEFLVAQALQELLKDEGYHVDIAENGVEALQLYDQKAYDLLVVDLFMPEKDGIATMMDLQRKQNDVKLIAISGGGTLLKNYDYLEYASALGALACFKKPIEPSPFLDAIAQNI